MIVSPLCKFCKKEVKPLEHLLFYLRCTEAVWQALTPWLRKQNIFVETLTLMTILFVGFSESKDDHIKSSETHGKVLYLQIQIEHYGSIIKGFHSKR